MNEQIKALAQQADEYAEQTVHYYMGQFDGLTWEGKIKQTRDIKFAELIVRECMEQLNISNVPTSISAGLNLGRVAIKEHFGVDK